MTPKNAVVHPNRNPSKWSARILGPPPPSSPRSAGSWDLEESYPSTLTFVPFGETMGGRP